MDSYIIRGGHRLVGSINIGGSPVAALPIMAACIMAEGVTTLSNVPRLADIQWMGRLLEELGCRVEQRAESEADPSLGDTWRIEAVDESRCEVSDSIVRSLKQAMCVLGAMLGRRGRVRLWDPAASAIGDLPLPAQRVAGLVRMGAEFRMYGGIIGTVPGRLHGCRFCLDHADGPGVVEVTNIICAATLAEGSTEIIGAPCDPELGDLIDLLNRMGARITGAGSPEIRIDGVAKLRGCAHRLLPDRMESGLWMTAAAITGGELHLTACNPHNLSAEIDLLEQMGVEIRSSGDTLFIRSSRPLASTIVTTAAYPGFPTHLQPPLTALLSLADGRSVVTDGMFAERFWHLGELRRMGAKIGLDGYTAMIQGVPGLCGTHVSAFDGQVAVAMVLAGLAAKGTTRLDRIHHIDRRYDHLDRPLLRLGAQIERICS